MHDNVATSHKIDSDHHAMYSFRFLVRELGIGYAFMAD